MSKKKESKSNNWRLNYQDRISYYESQAAAIVAVNLILSSCESGIWCENSYLYLSYQKGETTVDRELFNSHYSIKVLVPTSFDDMFRIDIFVKNKEDWIFKYGSDLLQQSILAGYECQDGYLTERLAQDYPSFKINDRKYIKVDTPNENCLYACLGYENAYCSSNNKNYYITIDNFLGKYQLIKPIIDPIAIIKSNSIGEAVTNSLFRRTEPKRSEYSNNIVPLIILSSSSFTILMIILYAIRLGMLP